MRTKEGMRATRARARESERERERERERASVGTAIIVGGVIVACVDNLNTLGGSDLTSSTLLLLLNPHTYIYYINTSAFTTLPF